MTTRCGSLKLTLNAKLVAIPRVGSRASVPEPPAQSQSADRVNTARVENLITSQPFLGGFDGPFTPRAFNFSTNSVAARCALSESSPIFLQ